MSSSPVTDDEHDNPKPTLIRLTIPERYYLLPGAAIIAGTTIGLVRGSRKASLRFLAENVHRPPTTVQGWYFYNKTKNYRVLLGGLKEAGVDAVKIGGVATGWVVIEEGCRRMGVEDVSEVAAGLGTAGLFSLAYRLPWKATSRTLVLGLMMGTIMRGLRWGREHLAEEARTRTSEGFETENAGVRDEGDGEVGAMVERLQGSSGRRE